MNALLHSHLYVTLVMAGSIWSVQWVQYPLFATVGPSDWARYHETHMRRIGFVVAPLMLVEVMTGVAILWLVPASTELFVASFSLLVVWGSTFVIQVPLHRELSLAWSPSKVRTLVRGNWIRTAAWTLRAVLLLGAVPRWVSA